MQLASRAWLRLCAFSLLALAALWPALDQAASLNEFRDAQYLLLYEDVAVDTVLRYGELPWNNPYYCGGIYALGAPQSRFVSPTFLLSLLFGATRAQVVIAFSMTVLGMEGAFRWLRQQTGTVIGPWVVAPVLGLNGLFATAFFNGWIHFYGFALVPWVLWGVHLVLHGERRGWLATVIFASWMVGFGGTYAPLFTSLYVVLEVVRVLLRAHSKGQLRLAVRLGWLGSVALLCLGLSAVRLWPLVETMTQADRIMAGSPGNTLGTLARAVLSGAQAELGDAGISGAYYFGPFLLPLVLVGAVRRRAWFTAGVLAFSVWAATGYAYGKGPFVWLRQLPVFAVVRYPERFLFFAGLYAGLLACWGMALIIEVAQQRRARIVGIAAVLLAATASCVGSVANTREFLRSVWWSPPPEVVDQPFAQARGNRWLASHVRALSRGSLSCQEAYPIAQSERLRGDLPQEEYLADPSAGTAKRRSWSPNRLRLDVQLTRPARLLVNQNYHPGWRSSIGRVVSADGLLAVDLPKGRHSVVLQFWPRSGIGGLAVSLTALGGLAVLYGRMRRKRNLWKGRDLPWTAASTLGPIAVGIGCWWLVPEPSAPATPLLNANRTRVVVPTLPKGVTPLDAEFAVPVRLEGARLPDHLSPSGVASFELYFQVTGDVPRSVGVFVHLEGPGQTRINADHEVVSASLFFRQAPQGKLLRDAFAVNLAEAPRGQWRAYAGLWHASGDGQRIPSRRPAKQDRVFLGQFSVR